MLRWIKARGKSLTAVVVAGLTVLAAALTDNHITSGEGLQIAIASTTAVSVYMVSDLDKFPWTKTTMAAALAALNFAVTIIDGGITPAESVGLVLAALGVLGVAASPAVVHLNRAASVVRSPYRT
jgi:hypothetical protein